MIIKPSEASNYICPIISLPNDITMCKGMNCMAWKEHINYYPMATKPRQEEYGCCGYMKNK
jgi:hypothetical protein